mmetsp:Transcript_136842/g.236985  ORF Transcript_136842/g.236985 Transcript_136842/m.236985 type:complete len:399 (+) Transcript_136842:44-1240(+)
MRLPSRRTCIVCKEDLPRESFNWCKELKIRSRVCSRCDPRSSTESEDEERMYRESLYDQRSGDRYEFDVEGYVPYTLTASVICLRFSQQAEQASSVIQESELAVDERGGYGVISEFLKNGCLELPSGLEILVGQSNVVDYLETSSSSTSLTSYPGEYMFAVFQSRKDETDANQRTTKKWRDAISTPHNTHQQIARRALQQEFLVSAPASASFVPLVALQTRKIKGSSNMLVTFAEISNNASSWLQTLDVDSINTELDRRRQTVETMIQSGSWDSLPLQEKEKIAPKMRRLHWLDVTDCIRVMQESISWYFLPINEWQATEFAAHGLTVRSSMSSSLASLLKIATMGRQKLLARAERYSSYAPQEADAELRHLIDLESERFSKRAHRLANSLRPKASKL